MSSALNTRIPRYAMALMHVEILGLAKFLSTNRTLQDVAMNAEGGVDFKRMRLPSELPSVTFHFRE